MQPGQPSLTALGAATHRAAHQVLEQGSIFCDPLALRIVGKDAATVAREAEEKPASRVLRLFIAARTRFAEDALARAIARDTRQLVVLGAGLDTYAYRHDFSDGLRVFEVDHPATQAWKRERLATANIAIPSLLTFAPIDFERETLAEGLTAAGFASTAASFFTWLGVTPYLTESAVLSTLQFIAELPGKSEVVFDYANPPESIAPEDGRAAHQELAARVAAIGEAFKSYFDTDALAAKLSAIGFADVEDLGPHEIAARYFGVKRRSGNSSNGGHIIRASALRHSPTLPSLPTSV